MNNAELNALSAIVMAEALARHGVDIAYAHHDGSYQYGNTTPFPEREALQVELSRRADAGGAEGWTGHARVELMGHRSYLGRIREVERYGAKMGEVQELLPSGEYGETHLWGGRALHTLTPVTIEQALYEAREANKQSVSCCVCERHLGTVQWGHPLYGAETPRCDQCEADGATPDKHSCHNCGGHKYKEGRIVPCHLTTCAEDPARPEWCAMMPF